ncbi:hypothetical protein PBRA_005427 [Plasmodiophora brassicae]|uniref:Uncharacterized protein n=1 Tax=Plasmodiophora brassicae TaxID=37360 RepID=A0A0G4IND3_PLABS|nr:hypothetical protein PBRA_005427 [Plasmodiophora brassicae]
MVDMKRLVKLYHPRNNNGRFQAWLKKTPGHQAKPYKGVYDSLEALLESIYRVFGDTWSEHVIVNVETLEA